jgi:hypothetical protein
MTQDRINHVAKAIAALTGVSPLKVLDLITVALVIDESSHQVGWDEAEHEETKRLFLEALGRIEQRAAPKQTHLRAA